MLINRYDIQDVTSDKKLEDKIMSIALKFAFYINYKRSHGFAPKGKWGDIKSFDIDLLIEAYTKHSNNSSRPDYKYKFDEFIKQLKDIRSKIILKNDKRKKKDTEI